MILSESYSAEWVYQFRNNPEYRKINPPVFEKMIHALGLLEKLSLSGLSFIFKGGSSLILLLNRFKRFSVDIDICTSQTNKEIEAILGNIIDGNPFISVSYDEKRSKNGSVPKAHYVFHYKSSFDPSGSIALDILFDINPYPSIVNREIKTLWLKTTEPYPLVQIPDIDSILGDKLTAFAPNTIGIPYFRGETKMGLEIIKQLYDISLLIDLSTNIEHISKSFDTIASKQIIYRSGSWNIEEIFNDIFQTSLLISRRNRSTLDSDKKRFVILQDGITSFNQFLSNESFRIEDAIRAAGKTAWLTSVLSSKKLNLFDIIKSKEYHMEEMIDMTDFQYLNKLKRTDPEAYFYWYKALENFNLEK